MRPRTEETVQALESNRTRRSPGAARPSEPTRAHGRGTREALPVPPSPDLSRAMVAGAAALTLTSIHHVYGAILYETPERYHAVGIAVAAFAIMFGAYTLGRKHPASLAGRVGWWGFWGVTAAVPVLLFGLVEGFYNHLVKVTMYFGGVPAGSFRRFFPDTIFELPNDVFFEATGVFQVVPSAVAGYYLVRLLAARRSQPWASDGTLASLGTEE